MSDEAKQRREAMLATLERTVRLCVCQWPIVKYRNGDGHDPHCPAHRPMFDILNEDDY